MDKWEDYVSNLQTKNGVPSIISFFVKGILICIPDVMADLILRELMTIGLNDDEMLSLVESNSSGEIYSFGENIIKNNFKSSYNPPNSSQMSENHIGKKQNP